MINMNSNGLLNQRSGFAARLNKPCLFLVMMVVVFIAACNPKHPGETELFIINSKQNKITVYAELAVSPAEKRSSLSKYDTIDFNRGVLFIYGSSRYINFSMRGARNDISVAYLDSMGVIAEVFDMLIDPNTNYQSTEKCRYALQMAYGWFNDNEIYPGDTVQIPREIKSLKPLF